MEKGKKLTKEELKGVGGGMIISDRCPKCGYDWTSVNINGRVRLVCSNPECPNHKRP